MENHKWDNLDTGDGTSAYQHLLFLVQVGVSFFHPHFVWLLWRFSRDANPIAPGLPVSSRSKFRSRSPPVTVPNLRQSPPASRRGVQRPGRVRPGRQVPRRRPQAAVVGRRGGRAVQGPSPARLGRAGWWCLSLPVSLAPLRRKVLLPLFWGGWVERQTKRKPANPFWGDL